MVVLVVEVLVEGDVVEVAPALPLAEPGCWVVVAG